LEASTGFSLHGPQQGIIKGYVFDLHPRLGSIRFEKNSLHGATLSSLSLRLVVPLEAAAVALFADAVGLTNLSAVAGAAGLLGALYALLPPPTELPAQPPIAPPLVAGGVPLLGHLLDFVKGPVGMIDNLRSQYRSMFTIRVGPQRITFMIGAGPQLQFIKAKDEVLDQAPVYGFTIPVFGVGIIYDSPLEERQQQVSAPGVPP
jgi:hypothetical protein